MWRDGTMKQPCIWVRNSMSRTCLFCISAFAYMHLKHNCMQVLSDHHSWNKNPKHQVSHLETVVTPGNAHSHNLPTLTQEFHSCREALSLEHCLTSWTIKPASPQSGISINLNNIWSSLFYTLQLPRAGSPYVMNEMVQWLKKKTEIMFCDSV